MPGARDYRSLPRAGFTLVELVVILIVLGILSAFIIPRFANVSTFSVREFDDRALAVLRYGQKMAIAQNTSVYVRLTGSSIALCYDANCNAGVPAPGGSNSRSTATLAACGNSSSWDCEAVPSGVSFTAVNAGGTSLIGGSATFFFSAQGKPYLTGQTEPNSTFSKLTINVVNSAGSYTFNVEQETGYVHR